MRVKVCDVPQSPEIIISRATFTGVIDASAECTERDEDLPQPGWVPDAEFDPNSLGCYEFALCTAQALYTVRYRPSSPKLLGGANLLADASAIIVDFDVDTDLGGDEVQVGGSPSPISSPRNPSPNTHLLSHAHSLSRSEHSCKARLTAATC